MDERGSGETGLPGQGGARRRSRIATRRSASAARAGWRRRRATRIEARLAAASRTRRAPTTPRTIAGAHARGSARAARTTPRPRVPEGAARSPASAATTWRSGWTATPRASRQMGGEGANWIGEAPFTDPQAHVPEPRRRHLQPLGRRWRSARRSPPSVNITYKILFNDAVAMTGGQPNEGGLTAPQIARELRAEGVGTIVVVTDEPARRTIDRARLPPRRHGAPPRRARRACSARCARSPASRRIDLRPDLRRREAAPPQARHVPRPRPPRLHQPELVCEGCGDCGVQVELRLGRAARDRVRPQAHASTSRTCNKDFSCLNGFCPSFVTARGRARCARRAAAPSSRCPTLPRARRCRRSTAPTTSSSPASAAPASSPSAR